MTYKQLLKLARSRKDYGVYIQQKYTTAKGVVKSRQIPATYKQIRSTIQRELKLTDKQYKAKYDVIRNKLRHYERVTGAKKQDALTYLYRKARSMEAHRRSGERYVQSNKSKFIESFSSRSSGIRSAEATKGERKLIFTHIEKTFGSGRTQDGLIYKNKYARAIAQNIKDPSKRLQALIDFADKRRKLVEEDKHGAIKEATNKIPFGSGDQRGYTYDIDSDIYDEIIEQYGDEGGSDY